MSLFDGGSDFNPRPSKALGVANVGAPLHGRPSEAPCSELRSGSHIASVWPQRSLLGALGLPSADRILRCGNRCFRSVCEVRVGKDKAVSLQYLSADDRKMCTLRPGASDAERRRRIDMAWGFTISSLLTARSHRARLFDRRWAGSPERLARMSGLSVSAGGGTGPEIVRHRHDIVLSNQLAPSVALTS